MKKVMAVIVTAVFAVICALFVQGQLAVPALSTLSGVLAVSPDGLSYFAGESGNASPLYGVEEGGHIVEYYPQKPEGTEAEQVLRVCAGEEQIYEILEVKNPSTQRTIGYRLVSLERRTGEIQEIAEYDAVSFSEVLDLSIEYGKPVVSGIVQGGAYLAGYSGDDGRELVYMYPVPDGERPKECVYSGQTLFLMMQSGRTGKYTVMGFEDIREAGAPDSGDFLVRGKGTVWYYDGYLNRVIALSQNAKGGISVPDRLRLISGYMENMESLRLSGVRENETLILGGIGTGSYWERDDLSSSVKVASKLARPYIKRTVILAALGTVLFLLIWWVYGRNGKISLKLSFLCLFTCLALLAWWSWYMSMWDMAVKENRRLLWAGGISACLLALAFSLEVEYLTRPLRSLRRYMDRVASGNYQIKKSVRSHDEVSEVWAAMTRMCQSLEERRYRDGRLIRSYYRFVPRDIHQIFGKESILELKNGEVKSVSGNVGILSVQNREKIRASTLDGEYMNLIKRCFMLLHDTCLSHGGFLALGEFDLSGIRILEPGKNTGAVSFGNRLLTSNRENWRVSDEKPEMFLMVHQTDYLYGLTGTSDRSFPIFVSGEMEFLASYIDRFAGSGVGMVMTEQAILNKGEEKESRYIGYLKGPAGGKYHLHEILDVSPEAERQLKKKLRPEFEEALKLYYQDDFYLARNRFSTIVKECQEDGIAKWYLFASEYYFNSGEAGKIDYSLFHQMNEVGADHEILV